MKSGCIALAIAIGLVQTPAEAAIQLCLDATYVGLAYGEKNYAYSGRITGSDSGSAYGYWIIAVDETGAAWVQAGGATRTSGSVQDGRVRFAAHNGSAYPLSFRVARVPDEATFRWLRGRSRIGRALDDQEMSRFSFATGENDCLVDLLDEAPAMGPCSCTK